MDVFVCPSFCQGLTARAFRIAHIGLGCEYIGAGVCGIDTSYADLLDLAREDGASIGFVAS